MPEMFRERKYKSAERRALDMLLERMKKIVGDEINGLRIWYRAQALVNQIDQVYEVASRSQQMLRQMLDGDWPLEELPGVQRASARAQAWLTFVEYDDNPLSVGHESLQLLVENGGGEKRDEDVLIDSSVFLDNVRKANDAYQSILKGFECCEFNELADDGQKSFLQGIYDKCREICKCLV